MTCAKTHVTARLVATNSREYHGANNCLNPQPTCPRQAAEYARNDYRLCLEVCQQPGHAEVMALEAAGPAAQGGTMYVNHHRVCPACQAAMDRAGVRKVVVKRLA